MLPREFINKYTIKLSDIEAKLCLDAMHIMCKSLDVNHDESHIYRILGYLDKFISSNEYQEYKPQINLKILFIAILWHDTWKSERDPKSVLMLLPDMLYDGMGSALKFSKAAKKVGMRKKAIKKINYVIRKHSSVQFLPAKTQEAKLLRDFDTLDCFSLERIYLLEKKYILDRPFNWPTLRLAQFAAKVFVKNKKETDFHFIWSKKDFLKKQEKVLRKIMPEIDEYEQMLKFLDNDQQLEFKKMYVDLKEKYLTQPELLEKQIDPF